MLHEVRVYDKDGNVKKTISAKKVQEKYWEDFLPKVNILYGRGAVHDHRGYGTAECEFCKTTFKKNSSGQRYCVIPGDKKNSCLAKKHAADNAKNFKMVKCVKCKKPFKRVNRSYTHCQNPCQARKKDPLKPIRCRVCKEFFQPKSKTAVYCHNPCDHTMVKRGE